jgi:hypothetical protein
VEIIGHLIVQGNRDIPGMSQGLQFYHKLQAKGSQPEVSPDLDSQKSNNLNHKEGSEVHRHSGIERKFTEELRAFPLLLLWIDISVTEKMKGSRGKVK